MNVDLKITGTVESLHLEPGDRIIVTLDHPRPRSTDMEAVRDAVKEVFPDNEIILLAAGLRLVKETPA